jgi:hypothetical protein
MFRHIKSPMSRAGKFVIIASAMWLIASELYAAHRTNAGGLLDIVISLCFFGVVIYAVVLVFAEWRKRRWRAMIPLAACVLSVVVFIPLGRLVSRAVFAWSLLSYEGVVQQIEFGSIPVSGEYAEIRGAEREARLAYGVFADKDTNGVLTVMFFTESGFPALHGGYIYRSSGELSAELESRWPIREKVRSKWFYFSN